MEPVLGPRGQVMDQTKSIKGAGDVSHAIASLPASQEDRHVKEGSDQQK